MKKTEKSIQLTFAKKCEELGIPLHKGMALAKYLKERGAIENKSECQKILDILDRVDWEDVIKKNILKEEFSGVEVVDEQDLARAIRDKIKETLNFKLPKEKEQKSDLREKLAELEHKQWIHWAKNILKSENISQERRERWEKYFCEYRNLPETVKEQDRIWADNVLEIFKKYIIELKIKQIPAVATVLVEYEKIHPRKKAREMFDILCEQIKRALLREIFKKKNNKNYIREE